MWQTGERAMPISSVANNGAGRAATISGKYKVTVNRGGGNVQALVLRRFAPRIHRLVDAE